MKRPASTSVFLAIAVGNLVYALPNCVCPWTVFQGGWCRPCRVGFIASIKVESEMLFEELDAHGHDVDPKVIQCEKCRQAILTDGYCNDSRMGFVRGQAYLSRLTYHLAKGKPLDVSGINCPACRKNAARHGWCESCDFGMIGNVAIADRSDYRLAFPEIERLFAAIDQLKTCETCAIALFADGFCPTCKKTYKDRKATITP